MQQGRRRVRQALQQDAKLPAPPVQAALLWGGVRALRTPLWPTPGVRQLQVRVPLPRRPLPPVQENARFGVPLRQEQDQHPVQEEGQPGEAEMPAQVPSVFRLPPPVQGVTHVPRRGVPQLHCRVLASPQPVRTHVSCALPRHRGQAEGGQEREEK